MNVFKISEKLFWPSDKIQLSENYILIEKWFQLEKFVSLSRNKSFEYLLFSCVGLKHQKRNSKNSLPGAMRSVVSTVIQGLKNIGCILFPIFEVTFLRNWWLEFFPQCLNRLLFTCRSFIEENFGLNPVLTWRLRPAKTAKSMYIDIETYSSKLPADFHPSSQSTIFNSCRGFRLKKSMFWCFGTETCQTGSKFPLQGINRRLCFGMAFYKYQSVHWGLNRGFPVGTFEKWFECQV